MITDCHVLEVKQYDIANGPGIRTSVWVAGCSHQCDGCHNPNTWKWTQGKELTAGFINKIIDSCKEDYIAGMTLTGGDPLFIKNREGLTELCKEFRKKYGESKTIWLWTGYTLNEVKDLEILQYIDVIVDGKYDKSLKDVSLTYAGSTNQKVIYLKEIR